MRRLLASPSCVNPSVTKVALPMTHTRRRLSVRFHPIFKANTFPLPELPLNVHCIVFARPSSHLVQRFFQSCATHVRLYCAHTHTLLLTFALERKKKKAKQQKRKKVNIWLVFASNKYTFRSMRFSVWTALLFLFCQSQRTQIPSVWKRMLYVPAVKWLDRKKYRLRCIYLTDYTIQITAKYICVAARVHVFAPTTTVLRPPLLLLLLGFMHFAHVFQFIVK